VSREAYDAFVRAVEAGLRQDYPGWEWEVLRYKYLPFADTRCGPPPWIRITASYQAPSGSVILRYKHWIFDTRCVTTAVTSIGAWMEQARVIEMREHDRRVKLLIIGQRERP
jgi:hypothetical protein